MGKPKKQSSPNAIAQNRKARFDYHLEQFFEAGLSLQGWEVKALREGKGNLTESYVMLKEGETKDGYGCDQDVLRPGEVGTIVRDDHDHTPYKVRGPRDDCAWFKKDQLVSARAMLPKFALRRYTSLSQHEEACAHVRKSRCDLRSDARHDELGPRSDGRHASGIAHGARGTRRSA